jgi:hypothetical protein
MLRFYDGGSSSSSHDIFELFILKIIVLNAIEPPGSQGKKVYFCRH